MMIKNFYLFQEINIEFVNKKIFFLINATPQSNKNFVLLAFFLAKYFILILVLLIITTFIFCLKNKISKKIIFFKKTILSLCYTTILYLSFSLTFPHPRPFVISCGYQFINHLNNNSYPSKHGILIFTFAFSFLFWHHWLYGILLIFSSIIIAWSRIYLGIHWPLDMISSIILSLLSCLLAQQTYKKFIYKI